jgi:hypothetical protein
MSAAVWNEPEATECARRDARRGVGGGWNLGVLTVLPPPRGTAAEGLPRAGDPSPAETA